MANPAPRSGRDGRFNAILTPAGGLFIMPPDQTAPCFAGDDGPDLHRHCGGLLFGQRFIRTFLRETVIMENLIVGGISLLLFTYLVIAMLKPEKF